VKKLDNLLQQTAAALAAAKYAIALTGAGISTESGIPDFRGPDGVWTKDPAAERRAYQTFHAFLANPRRFWEETLDRPSNLGDLSRVEPNPGHLALAAMEEMGVLKCVITQNIDGLHRKAGSRRLLEYHGNSFRLRCLACGARCERDNAALRRLQLAGKLPPLCQECGEPLKSDVVFFNEPIPTDVAAQSEAEADRCDLMLICGTSAAVYPFASLPQTARRRPAVKIIEVNAEPTPLTRGHVSDCLLQGKTGEILPRLAAAVKRIKEEK
jgi:NAD-dependent deacetylase